MSAFSASAGKMSPPLPRAILTWSSFWEGAPPVFPQLPAIRGAAYAFRRHFAEPAYLLHALAWGFGLGSVTATMERTHATPAFWGTLLFAFCITYFSTVPWRMRLVRPPAHPLRIATAGRSPAVARHGWKILLLNGLLATVTGYLLLLLCLGIPVAMKYKVSLLLLLRLMQPVQVFIAFTGAVCFPLVGYAIVILQERKRDQKRLAERVRRMERLAEEARLVALRAQINPHFFFNTLNTIAALIPARPADAERAVELLASALRPVLAGSESGQGERRLAIAAPLRAELEVAEAYAELEQLRFGGRLRVSFSLEASASEFLLPVLCLQPLLENAIRHGSPSTGEDYLVHVSVRTVEKEYTGPALEVRISNAPLSLFEGHAAGAENPSLLPALVEALPDLERAGVTPGHALANIQARLRAMFGSAASFEVRVSSARRAAVARIEVPPVLRLSPSNLTARLLCDSRSESKA